MHRTLRALLGISLLTPAAAGAQTDDARVNAAVERFTPQITELRHRIHQNPELGNREVETAALVAQHLRSLGMEVRTLAAQLRPTLERVVGKENVSEVAPTTGAEDFAFFSNAAPGFYYRLGAVKPGTKSGGHHTPTFMADDASIPVGIRAMSTLVLAYLAAAGQ